MTENKVNLQEGAMRYGTKMGLLWAFKFILFPLGFRIPFLQLIFIVLTLGVPILGYVFVKKFRDRQCGGEISFARALLFTTFMFMYASLFVAVIHYIYYQYLDNGFIFNACKEILEQIKADATPEMLASLNPAIEQFNSAVEFITPLQMTFEMMSQNIMFGMLMAIPIALLVMRKKKI